MAKYSCELDMTKGSVWGNVISFAIPLIIGNVLQLMYNAADIIVVSRWAGSAAMAAVGATSAPNALIVNLCSGLSVGATVLVSRRFGSKDEAGVHRAVHTSVSLGIVAGVIACIMGLLFSAPLLNLMGTPEGEVATGAVIYMRIYFLGVPGLLMYNFSAAILRAVGDTKRPLYILAFSGMVNIILNLFFVIVCSMSVAGVAIATSVSNYTSAFMAIFALVKSSGAYRLELTKLRIYKNEVKSILKIGVPGALQGSVFALSNSVVQAAVNSFGSIAVAGCTAASSIETFVYTAMNGFYHSSITGVSQNYGAKNEKRIYQYIGVSVIWVSVTGIVLGTLVVVFSKQLLGIYITDSAEAVRIAQIRLLFTALPQFLSGMMDVLSGALRGLGHSVTTAVNSLIGVCGTRLLWVFCVLPAFRSERTLFLCWPISWIVVVSMHLIYFFVVRKKVMKKMLM